MHEGSLVELILNRSKIMKSSSRSDITVNPLLNTDIPVVSVWRSFTERTPTAPSQPENILKLPGELDVTFVWLLQSHVELFVVVGPHGVDPVVVAGSQVGGAELGDGGVHLLDVVEGLGRHPGPRHGLGHQLEQRPLVMAGRAPQH